MDTRTTTTLTHLSLAAVFVAGDIRVRADVVRVVPVDGSPAVAAVDEG